MQHFSIAVHGGAGTILKSMMTPQRELLYTKALKEAIRAGISVLSENGTALDAVEKTVRYLEDHSLFNAGKASVFTHDGKNEMDAAIMDGKNLRAGAVACVKNIKNPVTLARQVMLHSEHVLLTGEGAQKFAQEMKTETAPDSYFFSKHRYKQLQMALRANETILDHNDGKEKKFGTVGAVALDCNGNLAAATSTGGMTNKKFGRIGDSPIIGAGTYANNFTCAVSCTGHGEFFMRSLVAYDISCLMEYKGMTLKQACNHVVYEKLVGQGGEGGLVAVDKNGNVEMPFNTEGMYRAGMQMNGEIEIGIFKEAIS